MRRWFGLDATCLVTGAIAPDFEYFLQARMKSNVSHTLPGLFAFDVPVAIALAVVFHALIRAPLTTALPEAVRARFAVFLATPWRPRAVVVVASALVGATTHVLWDSFTHRTGFFVEHIALLHAHVVGVPAYRLLQHASTVLGLLLIAVAVARLPRRSTATGVDAELAPSAVARAVFIVTPLVFGLGAGALRWATEPRWDTAYGHAIAAAIAGGCAGICVAAAITTSVIRRARREP